MSAQERPGPLVRHEQVHIADGTPWKKLPMISGVVGVIALGAGYVVATGGGGDLAKFYSSYLTAYMTFLALGLGGLLFAMIQHAARAGWSIVVRRIAENMAVTLPLMAVLVLPVVFMAGPELYHWMEPGVVEHDEVLRAKAAYLNIGAFETRAVVYIAIWALLGLGFWSWSTRQDKVADAAPLEHRMRFFAPVGIVLYALSSTYAAVDWMMTLDPHWFSTMFGVYYFAGTFVTVHAFLALMVVMLHRSGYLRGVVTKEHYHDLGKYMFAFTVFWAYIGFSQYFLIWYASIPEETEWFSYRGHGDFLWLSLLLVFTRFAFPFLGLISRHIKRNPKTLVFWAVWILVSELIDVYWLVQPALAHRRGVHEIHIDVYDITTLLGIGGLWLAAFTWALGRNALVPMKDPRLEESITFVNF